MCVNCDGIPYRGERGCFRGIHDRYRWAYHILKAYGHTPAKALEILIDAKRGNRHALQWIRMIHRARQVGA